MKQRELDVYGETESRWFEKTAMCLILMFVDVENEKVLSVCFLEENCDLCVDAETGWPPEEMSL